MTKRSASAKAAWLAAAAAVTLGLPLTFGAPAQAQMPNLNLISETPSKTPEELEREKLTDKAYKDSLRKIPDAKASNDPWGNVREAAVPAKPAAPKTAAPKAAQAKARPPGAAN